MTSPIVSAGTKIYISANTVAENSASAFAALRWTQIKGVRLAGELGNVWQTRDDFLISNNFLTKKKTTLLYNTMALELITVVDDAGQALLRAASEVLANYSFKVERKDGGLRYFTGQVTKYIEGQGGGGKTLFDATSTVDPQSAVIFA